MSVRGYYDAAYVGSGHAFDTTRKAAWIAESLESRPIVGLEVTVPPALTEPDVAGVHDRRYVPAVRSGQPRNLAESQGFEWDEALWSMVLSSNGGAVAAASGRDCASGTICVHNVARRVFGGRPTFRIADALDFK
jgi:acetoin utilization deacetylase AcuC-like enzyme